MALDIDVYFSDDAEVSWTKMKEAVKVSLFKPEILRVHGLKEIEGFDLSNTLQNIQCLIKVGL
jgi:hypothetical protein